MAGQHTLTTALSHTHPYTRAYIHTRALVTTLFRITSKELGNGLAECSEEESAA